jgi:hypothetical protein
MKTIAQLISRTVTVLTAVTVLAYLGVEFHHDESRPLISPAAQR